MQQTLRTLKENIDNILKKYPEWIDLPLCSSTDDEGNNYHKVYNDITPVQVEDINEYFLEVVDFFDDEEPDDNKRGVSQHDVNCICVN